MRGLGLRRFCCPPSDWLQRLQMVRVFSKVSVPPRACGRMWSASGLLGRLLYSQSNPVPHSGQRVRPASRSCLRRWLRTRNQVLVPVREVAIDPPMVVSVMLAACL